MSKCIGCGITIKNTDKNNLGYTLKIDNKYCERCFKTIHYNEERKIENIDNSKIINKINKLGYLTIFITDLLSINKSLIDVFKSINNDKILVINKCDIIPDNLKLEHIEENIKNSFNIDDDICFISAKKNLYLNKIINKIEEYNTVILCGETSSGKSTLINNLIGSNLTTSKYSNTTLDFIKLKYMDYTIYDTPGILINENKKSIENIKILTKQMNDNYVLTVGNLKLRCNGNITLFFSDNIKINTKKENVNLDNKINITKSSDIELLDGGFIFVKNPCIIESNLKLNVRDSIIGKN